MTRDQLRPLEGQLVLASFVRASTARRGDLDVDLLKAVRIWRWDGDRAVPSDSDWSKAWGPPDAVVDHLWGLRGKRPGLELLQRGWAAGRVAWYRRADGSVDLGVKRIRSAVLEEVLEPVVTAGLQGSTAKAMAALAGGLEALEEGIRHGHPVATVAPGGTAAELRNWHRLLEMLRRSAEAEGRARVGALIATSSGRRPSRPPLVAGRRRALHQSAPALGFR